MILLMQPPWFRLQNSSLVHYPVGPSYIASVLEKAGYEVLVWNVDYDPTFCSTIGGTNILSTDELTKNYNIYKENLSNISKPIWYEIRNKIKTLKPSIVGISVYSATYKSAINLAKIIKEVDSNIKIIFGGIHPTIAPQEVCSNNEVDYVVIGEGEETIKELVYAIYTNSEVKNIKGIAYKNGKDIIINPKRDLIDNLDSIPWPARHKLLDIDIFPPTAFQAIYGSRGCPFKCIFCGSFNLWGYKVRMRSAENIASEIEYTNKTFKTRYFYICDDIFFMKKQRAIEFCEILIKKNLKIYWSAQTRAEIIDDELLRLMKKSGGQHVAVGVETGDEQIRKLIKKGNTLDDMRRAANLIHKHGLTLVGFFMFGFPWETKEHIQKTVNFMKEIKPRFAFPYIVTPAPGTELAQISHEMGLIDMNANLEDFYHESPKMCISAKIHENEKETLINQVLEIFADYNRKNFIKDLFRRPFFYYSLLHDYGVFKNPRTILQYLNSIIRN